MEKSSSKTDINSSITDSMFNEIINYNTLDIPQDIENEITKLYRIDNNCQTQYFNKEKIDDLNSFVSPSNIGTFKKLLFTEAPFELKFFACEALIELFTNHFNELNPSENMDIYLRLIYILFQFRGEFFNEIMPEKENEENEENKEKTANKKNEDNETSKKRSKILFNMLIKVLVRFVRVYYPVMKEMSLFYNDLNGTSKSHKDLTSNRLILKISTELILEFQENLILPKTLKILNKAKKTLTDFKLGFLLDSFYRASDTMKILREKIGKIDAKIYITICSEITSFMNECFDYAEDTNAKSDDYSKYEIKPSYIPNNRQRCKNKSLDHMKLLELIDMTFDTYRKSLSIAIRKSKTGIYKWSIEEDNDEINNIKMHIKYFDDASNFYNYFNGNSNFYLDNTNNNNNLNDSTNNNDSNTNTNANTNDNTNNTNNNNNTNDNTTNNKQIIYEKSLISEDSKCTLNIIKLLMNLCSMKVDYMGYNKKIILIHFIGKINILYLLGYGFIHHEYFCQLIYRLKKNFYIIEFSDISYESFFKNMVNYYLETLNQINNGIDLIEGILYLLRFFGYFSASLKQLPGNFQLKMKEYLTTICNEFLKMNFENQISKIDDISESFGICCKGIFEFVLPEIIRQINEDKNNNKLLSLCFKIRFGIDSIKNNTCILEDEKLVQKEKSELLNELKMYNDNSKEISNENKLIIEFVLNVFNIQDMFIKFVKYNFSKKNNNTDNNNNDNSIINDKNDIYYTTNKKIKGDDDNEVNTNNVLNISKYFSLYANTLIYYLDFFVEFFLSRHLKVCYSIALKQILNQIEAKNTNDLLVYLLNNIFIFSKLNSNIMLTILNNNNNFTPLNKNTNNKNYIYNFNLNDIGINNELINGILKKIMDNIIIEPVYINKDCNNSNMFSPSSAIRENDLFSLSNESSDYLDINDSIYKENTSKISKKSCYSQQPTKDINYYLNPDFTISKSPFEAKAKISRKSMNDNLLQRRQKLVKEFPAFNKNSLSNINKSFSKPSRKRDISYNKGESLSALSSPKMGELPSIKEADDSSSSSKKRASESFSDNFIDNEVNNMDSHRKEHRNFSIEYQNSPKINGNYLTNKVNIYIGKLRISQEDFNKSLLFLYDAVLSCDDGTISDDIKFTFLSFSSDLLLKTCIPASYAIHQIFDLLGRRPPSVFAENARILRVLAASAIEPEAYEIILHSFTEPVSRIVEFVGNGIGVNKENMDLFNDTLAFFDSLFKHKSSDVYLQFNESEARHNIVNTLNTLVAKYYNFAKNCDINGFSSSLQFSYQILPISLICSIYDSVLSRFINNSCQEKGPKPFIYYTYVPLSITLSQLCLSVNVEDIIGFSSNFNSFFPLIRELYSKDIGGRIELFVEDKHGHLKDNVCSGDCKEDNDINMNENNSNNENKNNNENNNVELNNDNLDSNIKECFLCEVKYIDNIVDYMGKIMTYGQESSNKICTVPDSELKQIRNNHIAMHDIIYEWGLYYINNIQNKKKKIIKKYELFTTQYMSIYLKNIFNEKNIDIFINEILHTIFNLIINNELEYTDIEVQKMSKSFFVLSVLFHEKVKLKFKKNLKIEGLTEEDDINMNNTNTNTNTNANTTTVNNNDNNDIDSINMNNNNNNNNNNNSDNKGNNSKFNDSDIEYNYDLYNLNEKKTIKFRFDEVFLSIEDLIEKIENSVYVELSSEEIEEYFEAFLTKVKEMIKNIVKILQEKKIVYDNSDTNDNNISDYE